MSFYYGSGKHEPEKEKGGGIKEILLIIWIVFRALALPLGVIFGGVGALIGLFILFAWQPLAGVAFLVVVAAAIGVRGIWELRHPPELK